MDPSLARFALTAGLALLLTAPASAQTSKGLAALGSEALPGPLPAASMAAVDGWPARPHVQARPLDGSPADKIVNGVALSGFPSVGLLLNGPSPSVCTGTLIGCSTFLTAAHCVVGDLDPTSYATYFQHSGLYAVESITVHPGYTNAPGSPHDLAVLRLTGPVVGIQPSQINTIGRPPFGETVTLTGFGRVGDPSFSYGIKRAGLAKTAACVLGSPSTHLCWNFEPPIGPPGSESTTCNGDSGGPVFADPGTGLVVVGATSAGTNQSCLPPNQVIAADTYIDRAWIAGAAGGDLGQTTCSSLPNAGTTTAPYIFGDGSLTAGRPSEDLAFQVPAGAQYLLVTLNHELLLPPSSQNDFDLLLNPGSPAQPGSALCSSENFSPFPEFCLVENPAAGTWYIRAQRFAGAGIYQVTATLFGSTGTGTGCTPDANTLCIDDQPGDGRFEARMSWNRPGAFGQAGVVPLSSVGVGRGGLFWIGNASNPEVLIKVLNACAVNGNYWVFYSAGTNQGFEIQVRDTNTGATWNAVNPNGTLAAPVADTGAFSCN